MTADARRLLVLGAGRHQVPLIQRAEERGIAVVVADYLPNSPGKAIASFPTMANAFDVDAVTEVAKEYGVDGIVTTGTDQPVVAMAEVARRYSLPEILTPDTARIATDKRVMKAVLEAAGIEISRYEIASSSAIPEAVNRLHLPVVVKPVDSQGQRGTRRVDDRADLAAAVSAAVAASRCGQAIVEEFVEGNEITASIWVNDGVVEPLIVTDRVTYNPPPAIGIAVQHIYPSAHAAPAARDVLELLERIRAAYGVEHGPMYVQMIVTPDATVRLVEAACRVGGGHEISLIPLVTGVDLRDRLIDLALDGTCDSAKREDARAAHALVNFLLARPGALAAQHGMSELIDERVVVEGAFYFDEGYEQGPVVDGQGRVGYFIAAENARDALLARARYAHDRLSIRGAGHEELLFWPEDAWTRR